MPGGASFLSDKSYLKESYLAFPQPSEKSTFNFKFRPVSKLALSAKVSVVGCFAFDAEGVQVAVSCLLRFLASGSRCCDELPTQRQKTPRTRWYLAEIAEHIKTWAARDAH